MQRNGCGSIFVCLVLPVPWSENFVPYTEAGLGKPTIGGTVFFVSLGALGALGVKNAGPKQENNQGRAPPQFSSPAVNGVHGDLVLNLRSLSG